MLRYSINYGVASAASYEYKRRAGVTIDTVAQNALVLDPINATDPVGGQAEPGSTVTVTYPDGTTATVVAGTDGSWSVPNPGNLWLVDTSAATAATPVGDTASTRTAINEKRPQTQLAPLSSDVIH